MPREVSEAAVSEEESEGDDSHDQGNFNHRDDDLHAASSLDPEIVDAAQYEDDDDPDQLTIFYFEKRPAGADVPWKDRHRIAQRGKEDRQIRVQARSQSGNRAALCDPELSPAVEETPKGTVGGTEIYVLSPSLRHGSGELGISESAKKSQDARKHPYTKKHVDGADRANHGRGDKKDSAPDHRADDDRHGRPESKGTLKGRLRRRQGGSIHHRASSLVGACRKNGKKLVAYPTAKVAIEPISTYQV